MVGGEPFATHNYNLNVGLGLPGRASIPPATR